MNKISGFWFLAALLGLTISLAARAVGPADSEIVSQIVKRAQGSENAVVIFDIDDTLSNTGHRQLRIYQDLAKDPEFSTRFSNEAALLKNLSLANMTYHRNTTLAQVGIHRPEVVAAASDFWFSRFFLNEYVVLDGVRPGSVDLVNQLHGQRLFIVYLTGRNEPGMGEGTRQWIKANGFPTGANTALLMKPNFEMDDLDFKAQALDRVRQFGTVVASFENDPHNANHIAKIFPNAAHFFLNTTRADMKIMANDGIRVLEHFSCVKVLDQLLVGVGSSR